MLNENPFSLLTLPTASEEFLATWDNLPLDPYGGGTQRYRRFSQYRIRFEAQRWVLELLPHRPFMQPRQYNTFVGGIPRHFEPILINPELYVNIVAESIPLERSTDWQINVHQIRVLATKNIRGVIDPEGPHQDGHRYASILVVRQRNIGAGETFIYPLGGCDPLFSTTIRENSGIVLNDRAVRNFTTDIEPVGGAGCKDFWIIVFNRWSEKRYGAEYEADILGRPYVFQKNLEAELISTMLPQ